MEKIKVLLLLHISCLLHHKNSTVPTDMLISHEFLMQKFSCVDSKHDFLNNLVCNPFNGNEGMLNASIQLCGCVHVLTLKCAMQYRRYIARHIKTLI